MNDGIQSNEKILLMLALWRLKRQSVYMANVAVAAVSFHWIQHSPQTLVLCHLFLSRLRNVDVTLGVYSSRRSGSAPDSSLLQHLVPSRSAQPSPHNKLHIVRSTRCFSDTCLVPKHSSPLVDMVWDECVGLFGSHCRLNCQDSGIYELRNRTEETSAQKDTVCNVTAGRRLFAVGRITSNQTAS